MPRIAINPFVRRQLMGSRFSSIESDDFDRVRQLAEEHFAKAKPGYRDGVLLVPVPADGFYTSLVRLQPGDTLAGIYAGRVEGEPPRKQYWAAQPRFNKAPAVRVDIVIYRKNVLAEDGSVSDETADWEVVSINASPIDGEVPMPPETLMANHFGWPGGTATNMTPAEFVHALKISAEFWRDWASVQ